jgi:hypothetical protein
MDSNKIMNTEFNVIYDSIGDVGNMVDAFYAKHILFNKGVDANSKLFEQVSKLQQMMSEVKCLAHDIAERLTWDQ